ncbi:MAG: DNA-binding protein [Tissierellia bacterium]|nr:DNA-binding protein [Tissierellia bacterium]
MEGTIKNGKAFLRVDKGEDVIEAVMDFLKKHQITAGSISGLGASDHIVVGLFDTREKKYFQKTYKGIFEVTNFTGNITTKDGEVYLHMHITFSDEDNHAFGGHLNYCNISGACELFIDIFDDRVERFFDEEIGLNLLKF